MSAYKGADLENVHTNHTDDKFGALESSEEVLGGGEAIDATRDRAKDVDAGLDMAVVRRVRRRIDLRLVPCLAALYSISLIDRTNLGLAAVAGMVKELKLDANQYSIAALMFFVPYIIAEIPSNIGIRKFGAANWLAGAAFCWGVVQIGQGFVHSGPALTACRALMGLFEAALFPGAAYLLACWNVRSEVQFRMSMFYALSIFISGLSAIMAYGFTHIETATLKGWRWIFIIEGILTVAIAGVAWWFIVDFPDSNKAKKLLTDEERKTVNARIEQDRGDSVYDPLTLGKVGRYLLVPTYWAYGLMFMGTTLVSYALAYFMPLLLRGMGFSVANAQILTFPPYVAAFIYAVSCGYLSDKFGNRSAFIMTNAILNIIACALLGYTEAVGARYFACFLACMGANANVPLIVGWMHSCISGQSKRAYGSALVVAFGGIGGIVATTAFRTSDAPKYPMGIKTTLGLNAMVFVVAGVLAATWHVRNKKAARGELIIGGVPGMRYML